MKRLLLVAALAVLTPVTQVSAQSPARPGAETPAESLRIVSQPFNILTSVNARFVVSAPPAAVADRRDRIEVRVHRRVASRDSLRTIADGAAVPAVIDRHVVRLSSVRRDEGGRLVIEVPMSLTSDPTAVVIPFDGIFPVSIAVVDAQSGADLVSALTFVNRRDPVTAGPGVQASVLVALTAKPSIALDGPVVVAEEARQSVRRVISLLSESSSPVTLVVQPELVAALAESTDAVDVELFASLSTQLARRSVAAATFVHVDPAVINALDLADEWIAQFRLGVSTLNRHLPSVTVHNDTLVVTAPLDAPTVTMLRRAGVSSLVLLPRARENVEAEARPGVVSHPSKRDNETISVVSVDPQTASLLSTSSTTPSVTAHRVAAEIIAERDDLLAAGVDPSSIRLLASAPGATLADDGALALVHRALSGAPGIVATDFSFRASVTAANPATVFPPTISDPGNNRRGGLVAARRELDAVSTMVGDADPRRDRWARMLAIGASDQVDEPAQWVTALRSELRDVRQSVVVTTPTDITLSSRTTSIRLQVRNNSDAPLIVRVRLSSPKLLLTDPARTVELAPNALTEVVVPAVARTNGSFPVIVRLTTPEGALEVAPTVTVTARVTAVAGLGQLVSISLLLVLLAWWWSHRRKTRLAAGTHGETTPDPLR